MRACRAAGASARRRHQPHRRDALADDVHSLQHAPLVLSREADHKLFGLKVWIGTDGYVRVGGLQVAHDRVEARFDREHEVELVHNGSEPAAQELGFELVGHDPLQLARYAGKHEKPALVEPIDQAWRHAPTVAKDVIRTRRNPGHPPVAVGDLEGLDQTGLVHQPHAALDTLKHRLPRHKVPPERRRDGFERTVVRRRSQTPTAEDVLDLLIGKVGSEVVDDVFLAVPDHGDALEGEAEAAQPLGQPVGVGVQGEAGEKFVSDGDDGRSHGSVIAVPHSGEDANFTSTPKMAAVQLIEVQGLTKYYDSRPAIVDLTFSVPRGQVVGFVGPTGAGKSTMMRILTGYLSATSGSAWVAGYSVFEQSRETRKSIGYLPESAQLYNEMSVESYMHTMCRLRGVSPRKRRPRIDHALTVCGLTERRRDIIGHLSNGLRRRVGLAQALVHDPQVLLLDEPGASLDSTQTHETLQLIRALGDHHTVVLSSQILSVVSATCDRVLLINDGKLVADAAPSSLSRRLAEKRRRQVEVVIAGDPVAVDGQLRKLAGVAEVTVTSNGDGENRLTVTGDGNDLQDAVARVIVGQGLSLRHLNSRSLALEVTLPELAAQEAR